VTKKSKRSKPRRSPPLAPVTADAVSSPLPLEPLAAVAAAAFDTTTESVLSSAPSPPTERSLLPPAVMSAESTSLASNAWVLRPPPRALAMSVADDAAPLPVHSATSPEVLIRFRDVHKAFGPKRVYTGLDLDVYKGETLVILGGSGVGKSVMLKLLIGLLVPDQGSIHYRSDDVVGMTDHALAQVRQRVAMLFQAAALFDSISVRDNVAYALHEHHFRTMSREQIDERVAWALGLVGLPGVESMRPSDLSGGMKKRVGLARAIALQPEVLLYDEPTTGLDPINTTRINRLITSLQKNLKITSIVVTHDMRSAFEVGDRLAMVHRGKIILQDTNERFRNSDDDRVRSFIDGRAPEAESVESLLTE